MSELWDRSFSIDSLDAACRFVATVWHHDERVVPSRLHEHEPQPRDLSGAPAWTHTFARYVFASPDEVETVVSTDRGVHDERHYYRYPLWRSLKLLERREHDRWTKGVPRRPFHPTPASVLRAMAKADFQAELVRLRYSDGTRVPADMAELFAIGAARKLRGVYTETYVSWVDKSDSQKDAEDAA
jgi:hypothetical protein